MLAEMTFGHVAAGCGLTLLVTITAAIAAGLVMWPKVANKRIRELIPDDAEGIVDDASERVRGGLVDIALPIDPELRFYGLLQRAREIAGDQQPVVDALETARQNYKAPTDK